jgi:hypothetical protein
MPATTREPTPEFQVQSPKLRRNFILCPITGNLPVLVAHLTTQRDKENLKALQERLPDWLLTECAWVKDGRDEQGLACYVLRFVHTNVDSAGSFEVGLDT